jgi:hypothetical protein
MRPVPRGEGKPALTPVLLASFFAFATAMCALAGLSLLTPGGALQWVWRFKPDEYRQLHAFGAAAGAGFLALGVVMAVAAVGCFGRLAWGRRLAFAIIAVNAAGDSARAFSGAPGEGAVGVVVAGAILWWLTRAPVRAAFHR